MKFRTGVMTVLALSMTIIAQVGNAQQRYAKPSSTRAKHKQLYFSPHKPPMTADARAMIRNQVQSSQAIPIWNYSTVAQDGKTYTGSMVGRSPFAHGHRATTVPTYLVPVILQFQDSGDIFDPTVYDGCAPANESVISLILNSPLIGQPNFMRTLEEELGVRLLARTTRSVALTDAGERLISRLKPALTEVGETIGEIAGQSHRPAGRVRLLLPRLAVSSVLAPKVAKLHREYPDLVLDVTTDDT